jgi:hypothetical protein
MSLSPGPWSWSFGKGGAYLRPHDSDRAMLHVVEGAAWNPTGADLEAIALVPDLVAALRSMVAGDFDHGCCHCTGAWDPGVPHEVACPVLAARALLARIDGDK